MAARYGINVNLEFVTFAGVVDLAGAVEVLETVARPNARLMVDTLHAHRSGVTVDEIARTDPRLFGFIHLCDGPGPVPSLEDPSMIGVARAGRLYPGEGGVDTRRDGQSHSRGPGFDRAAQRGGNEEERSLRARESLPGNGRAYFAANGIA